MSENRAEMMREYGILSGLANERRAMPKGQTSLFDTNPEMGVAGGMKSGIVPDFPADERMEREKEMLGLYFTAHPLDRVKWVMERIGVSDSYRVKHPEEFEDEFGAAGGSDRVLLVGIMSGVRIITISKGKNKGRQMAVFNLEDYMGTLEIVMFSREYAGSRDVISCAPRVGRGVDNCGVGGGGVGGSEPVEDGKIVVVRGTVFRDPDRPFPVIHGKKVTDIEDAAEFFRRQDRKRNVEAEDGE
jgi:hypothetical protein